MNTFPEKPKPFPVRQHQGRWEVLLSSPDMWLECASEDDARVIAQSIVLRFEVLEEGKSGKAIAEKLEKAAAVLAKYQIGYMSRWCKHRAKAASAE